MNVYAIHEGSKWEPAGIRGNLLYYFLENATVVAYMRVDYLNKEYDWICNQGDSPNGKRWKEIKDERPFVVKSWSNGLDEIFIMEYEVK